MILNMPNRVSPRRWEGEPSVRTRTHGVPGSCSISVLVSILILRASFRFHACFQGRDARTSGPPIPAVVWFGFWIGRGFVPDPDDEDAYDGVEPWLHIFINYGWRIHGDFSFFAISPPPNNKKKEFEASRKGFFFVLHFSFSFRVTPSFFFGWRKRLDRESRVGVGGCIHGWTHEPHSQTSGK